MSAKESMQNRRRLALPFGFIILLTAIALTGNALGLETSFSSEYVAIHVVIENRTNERIGPFTLRDNHDSGELRISQIEPFAVADVYFRKAESWGESAITITDENGKEYAVVPYFENQQKGRVDIQVNCISKNGLSGKKRDLVSSYFSFEWRSWGASGCE